MGDGAEMVLGGRCSEGQSEQSLWGLVRAHVCGGGRGGTVDREAYGEVPDTHPSTRLHALSTHRMPEAVSSENRARAPPPGGTGLTHSSVGVS